MNQNYQQIIEKLEVGKVKFDEPMAGHTTFKIGGPADLFVEVENEEELVGVLRVVRPTFAKATAGKDVGVPYFILGGGSNILVGDKGFKGLIIKVQSDSLKTLLRGISAKYKVLVDAGVNMSNLINECLNNSLTGLEFMAGIPGTVGGSIRGNAGAWQNGISESVSRVKVLTEDNKVKWVDKEECQFSYRDSRFKHNKEIILAAELILEKGDSEQITRLIEENLKKREEQPKEPSAGCVFVNPKPLSAGKLIEECGLKGTRIGNAQISEKHANFVINLGGATAKDVVSLISLTKAKVKEKFSIDLKEEIVRIGEF